MRRVLVIGGTRFIGFHTIHALARAGCEVAVFHRGNTEPTGLPHCQHLHGDRSELLSFVGDFERFAPDVVLDMVPLVRADAVDAVLAFNGVAGRLVAISSQDVYLAYDILRDRAQQPPVPQPMAEDAPLREQLYPYRDLFPPDSRMYDYDKIPVEQTYLGEPDLPGTILRLPAVYGPDDYLHRPFPYLKRMVDGRRWIILDEDGARWRWSRTFVDNAAEAITRAVMDDAAAGRVYNVAEPVALTEAEWVRAVGTAYGWSGEIITLATEEVPEHLRDDEMNFAQDLVVQTTRIRQDLSYRELIEPGEAMARTVEWELANMPDELPPNRFDYETEDAALPDLTLGI
jgi:nucleoside-diphosphate-sugar epimerase